eukprot:scaffold24767_cov22-Tisochrysis_lutea.AAC.5
MPKLSSFLESSWTKSNTPPSIHSRQITDDTVEADEGAQQAATQGAPSGSSEAVQLGIAKLGQLHQR